jgi:hypothetical protein
MSKLVTNNFKILSKLKSPKIISNLIGGNVYVKADNTTKDINITTNIGDELIVKEDKNGDYIINGQNILRFVPQTSKVSYKISIPSNLNIDINMYAGVVKLEGKFNEINANLDIGVSYIYIYIYIFSMILLYINII